MCPGKPGRSPGSSLHCTIGGVNHWTENLSLSLSLYGSASQINTLKTQITAPGKGESCWAQARQRSRDTTAVGLKPVFLRPRAHSSGRRALLAGPGRGAGNPAPVASPPGAPSLLVLCLGVLQVQAENIRGHGGWGQPQSSANPSPEGHPGVCSPPWKDRRHPGLTFTASRWLGEDAPNSSFPGRRQTELWAPGLHPARATRHLGGSHPPSVTPGTTALTQLIRQGAESALPPHPRGPQGTPARTQRLMAPVSWPVTRDNPSPSGPWHSTEPRTSKPTDSFHSGPGGPRNPCPEAQA